MEISETTKHIFYFSRCLGLAPYRLVKKNPKSNIFEYQKNLPLVVFSVLFITTVASLTVKGIAEDASSDKPVRAKKSSTATVVTFLDFGAVVTTCLSGLLCGICSLQYTRELNRRLKEADNTLNLYASHNDKKDKTISWALLIAVLLITTSAIFLDLYAWQRNAIKLKGEESESTTFIDRNILGYIPFYMLYYIMMTIHLVFAQTTLGLGGRYKRLNEILRNVCDDERTPIVRMYPSMKNVNQTVDVLTLSGTTRHRHQDTKYIGLNAEDKVQRLACIHDTMVKAVGCVSSTFGFALLAILSSALLHIIVTSYFFLNEIMMQKDQFFTYIQALWLTVHLFRLILTVEPCNMTHIEARKTITIVCDLMRSTQDPCLQETLRQFFYQLLGNDVVVSACGLCQVDRRILTSYCGSICTYIIILMQFQKADG